MVSRILKNGVSLVKKISSLPDLKNFGIRNTRIVKAILEILEQSAQPMDFKDLIGHVLMKVGSLDRASFYRAMNRLQKKKLIIEVTHNKFISDFKKDSRFPKYLISCLNCRKTEKIIHLNQNIIPMVFSEHLSQLAIVTLSGVCCDCEPRTTFKKTQISELICN